MGGDVRRTMFLSDLVLWFCLCWKEVRWGTIREKSVHGILWRPSLFSASPILASWFFFVLFCMIYSHDHLPLSSILVDPFTRFTSFLPVSSSISSSSQPLNTLIPLHAPPGFIFLVVCFSYPPYWFSFVRHSTTSLAVYLVLFLHTFR